MMQRIPRSTLFPYTTLFRSGIDVPEGKLDHHAREVRRHILEALADFHVAGRALLVRNGQLLQLLHAPLKALARHLNLLVSPKTFALWRPRKPRRPEVSNFRLRGPLHVAMKVGFTCTLL